MYSPRHSLCGAMQLSMLTPSTWHMSKSSRGACARDVIRHLKERERNVQIGRYE